VLGSPSSSGRTMAPAIWQEPDRPPDDSMSSTVILTGVVGDYGSARCDESKGELDLSLSRGTFRIDPAELGRALPRADAPPLGQPAQLLGGGDGFRTCADRARLGQRCVLGSETRTW
jgi:hypothetical protein